MKPKPINYLTGYKFDKIIVTAKSPEYVNVVAKEIIDLYGANNIEVRLLDNASLESITTHTSRILYKLVDKSHEWDSCPYLYIC